MKIIITERQFKLIEGIIGNEVFCSNCNWNWDWKEEMKKGNKDIYICHKCRHDNTPKINESINDEDTSPIRYTYVSMKPYENKMYKVSKFYFNDVLPVSDDNPIPDKIKIEGPQGDFVFNKNDIKIDNNKKNISINTSTFNNEYPSYTKINNASSIGITSQNIKTALKLSFPNNWDEETNEITAGLRGVYTIGSKLNNIEDWSIMNYFDTKEEIHNLLYLKYKEDNVTTPIIDWLVDVFTTDKTFTQLLVNRQWTSISNGLNLERDSVTNFLNKIKSDKVTYYPHGSKMDRWFGVDVTIDDVNYQIKPLKSYEKSENGYIIKTYGMLDYQNKRKVNKLVFSNDKTAIVFNNVNYDVISKYQVLFRDEPTIII